MEIWLAYLAVGLFAGVAAGLLGIGGGLIIVPALAILMPMQGVGGLHVMHLAIGTSLATIILTSLSSIYAHHKRDAVEWQTVAKLVPGIVVGALVGAYLADQIASKSLQIIFGVFEIISFYSRQPTVLAVMDFFALPAPLFLSSSNSGYNFLQVFLFFLPFRCPIYFQMIEL